VVVEWSQQYDSDVSNFVLLKSSNGLTFDVVNTINVRDSQVSSFSYDAGQPSLSKDFSIYRLLAVKLSGDTVWCGDHGFDYFYEMDAHSNWLNDEARLALERDLEESKKNAASTLFKYTGFSLLLILLVAGYFWWRYKQARNERDALLDQMETIKRKGQARKVSEPDSRDELVLDRAKMEEAIEAKIGESAWLILELIYAKPSISNKEIAETVSLSVEGVSSALRRMYVLFEIETTSNKKIALIMEAARISSLD